MLMLRVRNLNLPVDDPKSIAGIFEFSDMESLTATMLVGVCDAIEKDGDSIPIKVLNQLNNLTNIIPVEEAQKDATKRMLVAQVMSVIAMGHFLEVIEVE